MTKYQAPKITFVNLKTVDIVTLSINTQEVADYGSLVYDIRDIWNA